MNRNRSFTLVTLFLTLSPSTQADSVATCHYRATEPFGISLDKVLILANTANLSGVDQTVSSVCKAENHFTSKGQIKACVKGDTSSLDDRRAKPISPAEEAENEEAFIKHGVPQDGMECGRSSSVWNLLNSPNRKVLDIAQKIQAREAWRNVSRTNEYPSYDIPEDYESRLKARLQETAATPAPPYSAKVAKKFDFDTQSSINPNQDNRLLAMEASVAGAGLCVAYGSMGCISAFNRLIELGTPADLGSGMFNGLPVSTGTCAGGPENDGKGRSRSKRG